MEKEFTKSYAIKRIAELTEQIEEWRSLYSALMKDCQMQIEEYNKIKNQLSDRESRWAKYSKKLCIEQLEKVKEYADIDFRKNCYINAVELDNFIDNQIEELKKGSEQNDK